MLRRVAREEMLRQVADVLPPFAQGRQLDRHHLEPPEEVLAELAFLHPLGEIAVGRADHAQIELDRLLAAHPLDLVLLQRPEDLPLQVERQVADLVEKQGAPVCQLELAELLPVRAGKRSPLVAEELALHQVRGDGGKIDRHEGARLAIAAGVDVPRQDFFSGAAVPGDQHGHRLGGDLLGHLDDRAHPRGAAQDHGAAHVRRLDVVQPLELAPGPELRQRLAHARDQLGRGEVLGDVIEGAGVHRLYRDGDVLQHRAHDHADIGMALPHDPQRFQAAHPRHLHVEQHQIEGGGPHALQRLLARGSHRRLHPAFVEDEMDVLTQVRVVVDDEDVRCRRHLRVTVPFPHACARRRPPGRGGARR